MATIYTMIPYDTENNYCVTVRKEDADQATEIINKAYNDYLKREDITDFQTYAEVLLNTENITFEFSIWKEEE